MNKKFTGFLYLFIITTLFLFSPKVFAASFDEILNSNYEIYRYTSSATTEDGSMPLSSYEAIKMPYKDSEIYDKDEGKLKTTDGKTFSFQLTYELNGEKITDIPSVGFDGEGNLLLRLSKEIPNGTPYSLNIVENVQESGNSIDKEIVHSGAIKEFRTSSEEPQKEAEGTTFLGNAWRLLTKGLSEAGKILIETLCKILVPIGDSFLDMISSAMGEVVTIDGAVYNKINKVDIDFFSKSDVTSSGLNTPLKNILKDAVNKVYVFLRNIVVVAFLAMLVFIGVKILYTSTATKKASYKSLFMAWVMGVIMLVFFPYVMKYAIRLNDALCKMISDDDKVYTAKQINGLSPALYGTDKFVAHMLLDGETVEDNAMLNVRYVGAKTYSIPLLIVYFIFIGQLFAILILYYKRVFMLAFLIAIFPIVVLIYPLNKIGTLKINPFGIWFKEFMVNVFVQSFHAATYKVIVELGVGAYQQSRNWLFMMICILFLFEGEKLLRAIFNAKSGANTIGDMAMAGAFAMKMMKSAGSILPSVSKKDDDSDDDLSAKEKANKDLNRSTPTLATSSNMDAVAGLTAAGGVAAGAASGSAAVGGTGSYTTNVITVPAQGSTSNATTGTNMIDKNIQSTKKKESNKTAKTMSNIGGTVFNVGSQITGGIIGATYGLAQTDTKNRLNSAVSGVVSGVSAGKAVGEGGKGILSGIVDRSATVRASKLVAKEYKEGKYDDQIGITEADRQLNSAKADAIRKAYARYARNSTKLRGKSAAQLSFYKDRMKIINEDLNRNSD